MTAKCHQRRKAGRQQRFQRPDFREFEQALRDSRGTVEIMIVSPAEILITKDQRTLSKVSGALVALSNNIVGSQVGKGPLCMTCDYEFMRYGPPPVLLAIITPHFSETQALASGICPYCAERSEEEIKAAVFERWKQTLPGSYLIDVSEAIQ